MRTKLIRDAHAGSRRKGERPTYNFAREVDQEDGSTDHVGHLSLGCFGNVVSDLMSAFDACLLVRSSDVVLVEPFDRVAVVHAHKRSRGSFELLAFRVTSPKLIDQGLDFGVGENSVDSLTDLTRTR